MLNMFTVRLLVVLVYIAIPSLSSGDLWQDAYDVLTYHVDVFTKEVVCANSISDWLKPWDVDLGIRLISSPDRGLWTGIKQDWIFEMRDVRSEVFIYEDINNNSVVTVSDRLLTDRDAGRAIEAWSWTRSELKYLRLHCGSDLSRGRAEEHCTCAEYSENSRWKNDSHHEEKHWIESEIKPNCNIFPRLTFEIFEEFVNVVVLGMYGVNITNLDYRAIQNLKSLELVQISKTHFGLEGLESGLFCSLSNLIAVNISYVSHSGSQANDVLKLLSCGIKSAARWLKVNVLESSNSEIISLDSHTFFDVMADYLNSLNIASNSIQTIEEYAFSRFFNLVNLDISNNALHQLNENVFNSFHKLHSLCMAGNKIKILGDTVFKPLKSLISLNVASNAINKINCRFVETNISFIMLRENFLAEIYSENFQNCTKLNVLDLSYNKIEIIASNAFRNTALVVLDLRENRLRNELQLQQSLDFWWILLLSENKLSKLLPLMFSLNCNYVCFLTVARIFVDFRENITVISPDNTQSINVSHNAIDFISQDAFTNISRLGSLILSFNKISHIHPGTFRNLYFFLQSIYVQTESRT